MSANIGGDITYRPRCSQCGINLASKGRKPGQYRSKCSRCRRAYGPGTKLQWRAHKKDHCENPDCTATGLIAAQLTVDHIDGDKENNDPSNLMTLCANCHALKTWENRDFVNVLLRKHDKINP